MAFPSRPDHGADSKASNFLRRHNTRNKTAFLANETPCQDRRLASAARCYDLQQSFLLPVNQHSFTGKISSEGVIVTPSATCNKMQTSRGFLVLMYPFCLAAEDGPIRRCRLERKQTGVPGGFRMFSFLLVLLRPKAYYGDSSALVKEKIGYRIRAKLVLGEGILLHVAKEAFRETESSVV